MRLPNSSQMIWCSRFRKKRSNQVSLSDPSSVKFGDGGIKQQKDMES